MPNHDGAGQQCCYDLAGYLMMSSDNKWGGTPMRSVWKYAIQVTVINLSDPIISEFYPGMRQTRSPPCHTGSRYVRSALMLDI